ncbi:DUF2939 domain-containing protein [Sphingomonas sp. 3-13AW]|uniref:DUF2939 domain-containing protein n=1 Tax=Sphingomonas sp. 3-13AW TaxID=3050450 RepID=UPI003BB48E24
MTAIEPRSEYIKRTEKMTKNRSITIGAGIGLTLVAALWLAVSPYLTLHRMQRAVAAKDAQTVTSYVDFDALRENLKQQTALEIARKVARDGKSPEAAKNAVAGVNAMIDAFVQPTLITMMLSDTRSSNNPIGGKIVGEDVSVRRSGLTQFEVSGSKGGAVVFQMRGLGWKLVGIRPAAAR